MKKLIGYILLLTIINSSSFSQNVGIGTNTPHPSAKLEVSSNNSGFLPPRMSTTERNQIANPAVGLQIYNSTTDCLEIYGRGKWNSIYCVPIDSSTLLTDIDGHTYPTVKICDQTWMAKNLDVARYRNGDIIPQVTDPTEWANLTTGAWCWYNNDSANGAVYGRLYNWYAVNDPRGLAPEGWHVPIIGEWQELIQCLGGEIDAGGKMKSIGNSLWESPNIDATNSSGFNGLPGGGIWPSSTFINLNKYGIWWSSGYNNNIRGWGLDLFNNSKAIGLFTDNFDYTFGFSVRCVKDISITTLNNGLVAYYPFSGNADDSSGNGNHGTVNGANLTTDRFGNNDKAYNFDGQSTIKVLRNNLLEPQNELSIICWIYPNYSPNQGSDEPGSATQILRKGGAFDNGYHLSWSILDNRNIESNYYASLGNIIHGTPNETLKNGWHNIIMTYSILTNQSRLYIDGNIVSSLQCSNILEHSDDLYIGGFNNFQFFNGKIDDIRIYNRTLTQAEITYLSTH